MNTAFPNSPKGSTAHDYKHWLAHQIDKSTTSALTNVSHFSDQLFESRRESYFLPKHLCQNWFLLLKPNK